jgi:hypothetical protein
MPAAISGPARGPLRAGERLPPDVGDRQPGHLDRPPTGIHRSRRRRRQAVQHQAAQNLDRKAKPA